MTKSIKIPDCYYPKEPAFVTPSGQTPNHSIYLSNLDDQRFLRFSIKYLYLYKRSVGVDSLQASLSKVLEEFYPLAGRLKASSFDAEKLELQCNGEGALFAEGFANISVDEFLEASLRPNISWKKLLYKVDDKSFVNIPPLVIQVTHLRCGGMILCTAISHCICDGIGTAQFLHSWAHITTKPNTALPVSPFHGRHMLKPRNPPQISSSHPEFTHPASQGTVSALLTQFLQCQQLVPVSATFTASQILQIKKLCIPSLKCTSFEALAAHVWRSWAMALDLPPSHKVKLLFSVNARSKLEPRLPMGFYGNGFVLACAETVVEQLVRSNRHYSVKLVKEAKENVNDEMVRSVIDILEERKMKPDLSASLVISQWSKLGLEDLDFGVGRPLHMGPLSSEIYCIFLPVVEDFHAFTVLMSVPEKAAENFEKFLKAY
ncbi:omega-hydroxypalmitate O-feruloyl transferase [Phalaenopsis equestris]|uniref:omega-hydroxypalmitate O-feruloyl transferase n=1 Tax=Phalaenopsis equestris TaxID=78828 RepID=UPI0009E202E2|nr:omega-hydroxypalmitate O-feruloyl transferase [Phalaenopsis equestris]